MVQPAFVSGSFLVTILEVSCTAFFLCRAALVAMQVPTVVDSTMP